MSSGLGWLRKFAWNVIQSQDHPVVESVEILMHQLITVLKSSSIDESSLIDLVGMDMVCQLPDFLDRKSQILSEWSLALSSSASSSSASPAVPTRYMGETLSQIRLVRESEVVRSKQLKKMQSKKKQINWISGYDDELAILSQLGLEEGSSSASARPAPGVASGGASSAVKVALPEGTTRHQFEGYEEYRIPSSVCEPSDLDAEELVAVSSLPEWAQPIFSDSPYLNRIQSKVFPVAFNQSANFLMCAPTGAGKTNVALLAIARLISEWKKDRNTYLPDFKVVYLAPMKALVSEIVEKFKTKLSGLKISVREFTADISIPRKEMETTNIVVTVPEKWDILMRNLGKVSPGESAILSQVKLMIIDEVHLLNDERGAIIESIVARTMQYAETACSPVRCVALSATFPNYGDIAQFLSVSKENTFFFDSRFRPVPLEQTIAGVGSLSSSRNLADLINKVTADKVNQILEEGEQVMVFVHARNDTVRTAEKLIDLISSKFGPDHLKPGSGTSSNSLLMNKSHTSSSSSRVRNTMNTLIQSGITIHHAGMMRPDRKLAEDLFKEGIARVLVCTSTLAWGVNLPSRYVIIKGTSIWDSSSGGFRDIDLLDILQIFGRAGRPQFDTIGRVTLITGKEKLDHFLKLMTSQIPIESRFISHLPDALNAEVAMGNISTVHEAVSWLKYTYMYVRFFKAPQKYGITDVASDPNLEQFRTDLINAAAENLNQARLIRVSRGILSSTDLGRVAAYFYVHWETAENFSTKIRSDMPDSEIIELIGNAREFAQLKCREDEMEELESVALDKTVCPVSKIRGGGMTYVASKVSVLLQVYVSRNYAFQSSSLSSDMNYISQNVSRLFRCLFEVSLTRTVGVSGLSQRLLEWCKIVERRLWSFDQGSGENHFLRHYTAPPTWFGGNVVPNNHSIKCIKEWMVAKLEEKRFGIEKIWDSGLSKGEISALVNHSPDAAKALNIFLRIVPKLEMSFRVIPISSQLMTVEISLSLVNPDWSETWSGLLEPFHVFLDDPNTEDILFHSAISFTKKDPSLVVSTTVPLTDPKPTQLTVSVVSDRYVSLEFFDTITVPKSAKLLETESLAKPTTLLDLHPLPIAALHNPAFEKLFSGSFTFFNPIQTQVFHQLYHQDGNVLVGAPTGSGKTAIAELAILRTFNQSGKVVYIAPMKALSKERIQDWQERIGKKLSKRVIELTGDFTPDTESVHKADVVVTTPEKWDGISRNWKSRKYVSQVSLVIIDEIHLLGQERGAILEVIVSRMRLMANEMKKKIRFVGLSTALANATDIASWLNVDSFTGLFNFKPSVRPVPMTVHVQGFPEKNYCPRMATMNKPCLQAIKTYSIEKPVIVFVSSRRQTRVTAFDLITYASQDTAHYQNLFQGPGRSPWLKLNPEIDPPIDSILERIENDALKHTLAFGVGIHHAGLSTGDRQLVESFFQTGKIQVLVATSTVSVGVNLPAHLVIVKGTEYYDGKQKKYVDMPTTDVIQMMGRAGRPQFDTSAVSVVMVHEPRKNFYRRFLYSPFPLESSLHKQLADHVNAEIANGSIRCVKHALEFLSWTYLFRRVSANPDFYIDQEDTSGCSENERVLQFLSSIVLKAVDHLEVSKCVNIHRPFSVMQNSEISFTPTKIGLVCALYYLKHETGHHLHNQLLAKGTEGWSFIQLAKIVADCSEFDEFPMRHKDDTYNEELAQTLPVSIPHADMDSPHTKGILVMIAHMWKVDMPIPDFFTDLKSLLDQSVRIIQAMLEIILIEPHRTSTLRSVLNLLLLNQCLAVGTHPWIDPVSFMLGRPPNGARLPELLEQVNSGIRVPGLDSRSVTLLKKMPLVNIEVSRTEGKKINVSVRNFNKPDEYSQTPLSNTDSPSVVIGKRRRVAWWIVMGSNTTGKVFAAKRVSITEKIKSIQFDEPDDPASVYLISDSYFGIDQEMAV